MQEYRDIRTILQKVTNQIGQKFLLLKKSKLLYHEYMYQMNFMAKKLLHHFMKKKLQNANQTEIRVETVTKK